MLSNHELTKLVLAMPVPIRRDPRSFAQRADAFLSALTYGAAVCAYCGSKAEGKACQCCGGPVEA